MYVYTSIPYCNDRFDKRTRERKSNTLNHNSSLRISFKLIQKITEMSEDFTH